jgi:hypothetical protein
MEVPDLVSLRPQQHIKTSSRFLSIYHRAVTLGVVVDALNYVHSLIQFQL